tara:strand:- start:1379 stop:2137 length:759 start_codon:yes stop_codon:yes gene_type:complete
MKHFLLTLTLTLFIINPIFSQDGGDFRVGLCTGLNYALPVGDDIEDWKDELEDDVDYYDDYEGMDLEASLNPRIGLNFGVTMDYFIADNFALSSGVSYSQKGFVTKSKVEADYYYGGDVEIERKGQFNLDYLDIPVALRFASDDGFEIFGGLMLGMLISDNVNVSAEFDGDNNSYYNEDYWDDYGDEIEDWEDAFDEDPESMVNGFIFGLGYTIDEQFNISLSGQQTGNFGETAYGDDNQNLTIQLRVGFYF